MWETPRSEEAERILTHEMPCPRCGHPPHLFLACGGDCECKPDGMPGDRLSD